MHTDAFGLGLAQAPEARQSFSCSRADIEPACFRKTLELQLGKVAEPDSLPVGPLCGHAHIQVESKKLFAYVVLKTPQQKVGMQRRRESMRRR